MHEPGGHGGSSGRRTGCIDRRAVRNVRGLPVQGAGSVQSAVHWPDNPQQRGSLWALPGGRLAAALRTEPLTFQPCRHPRVFISLSVLAVAPTFCLLFLLC